LKKSNSEKIKDLESLLIAIKDLAHFCILKIRGLCETCEVTEKYKQAKDELDKFSAISKEIERQCYRFQVEPKEVCAFDKSVNDCILRAIEIEPSEPAKKAFDDSVKKVRSTWLKLFELECSIETKMYSPKIDGQKQKALDLWNNGGLSWTKIEKLVDGEAVCPTAFAKRIRRYASVTGQRLRSAAKL